MLSSQPQRLSWLNTSIVIKHLSFFVIHFLSLSLDIISQIYMQTLIKGQIKTLNIFDRYLIYNKSYYNFNSKCGVPNIWTCKLSNNDKYLHQLLGMFPLLITCFMEEFLHPRQSNIISIEVVTLQKMEGRIKISFVIYWIIAIKRHRNAIKIIRCWQNDASRFPKTIFLISHWTCNFTTAVKTNIFTALI